MVMSLPLQLPLLLPLLLLILLGSDVSPFVPPSPRGIRIVGVPPTVLHDISEWRDIAIDLDAPTTTETEGLLPKEVCILPFPYHEVLLQGETKQLRLYEERFVQLFDEAIHQQCGVVAMGLIASKGLIQSVPLAEIEAYNRVPGFGIFVTIRVVARASLLTITQETPYIKAVCTELADHVLPVHSLEESNLLASNIENDMILLSSMEHRLETAKVEQGVEDPNDADLVMKQRILLAKLEDTYYDENTNEDDSDDDDDDEDDDESSVSVIDRRKRFRRAYEVALATDTQGYQSAAPMVTNDNSPAAKTSITSSADRSTRELTAVSWAALCTELLPEQDAVVRVQALDSTNLLERLQLAYSTMRFKKAKLRERMEKAGLKCSGDANDENDSEAVDETPRIS